MRRSRRKTDIKKGAGLHPRGGKASAFKVGSKRRAERFLSVVPFGQFSRSESRQLPRIALNRAASHSPMSLNVPLYPASTFRHLFVSQYTLPYCCRNKPAARCNRFSRLRQISWGRRACRECGERPGRERKPACHAGGLPKPGAVSLGNCSADAKATAAAKRREFWLKCDTFNQKNSRAGVASNNGWRASLNFFPALRPCLCAPQGLHRSDALTGRGRPALPAPAPLF